MFSPYVMSDSIATPWTVAHQAPLSMGFPGNSVVKNPPGNAGGLIPGSGRFPWRRKWQSTPVFLPGKCHGQRSLAGCSLLGCKRIRHDLVTKQQKKAFYYWPAPWTVEPGGLQSMGSQRVRHDWATNTHMIIQTKKKRKKKKLITPLSHNHRKYPGLLFQFPPFLFFPCNTHTHTHTHSIASPTLYFGTGWKFRDYTDL